MLNASGKSGINGTATDKSDGSFAGAALTEGNLMRMGCAGAWDAATSTMTVDCGGLSTLQACVIALKREGACTLP